MDIIKQMNANINSMLTRLSALEELNTLVVDPLDVIFNAVSVPKSPDAGYIVTSDPIDTALVKELWVFGINSIGTNTTILVNALDKTTSTTPTTLYPMTLNATTVPGSSCCITNLPPFIQIKVINNDTINAAIVTVNLSKKR